MTTDALAYPGLTLLSLVFYANALGVIDQSRAREELIGAGAPASLAGPAVAGGRVLQLLAATGLFVPALRVGAALALAAFLVPATLAAHAFWRGPREARPAQLANLLKNASLIGGLLLVALWRPVP
ncbi:MAG: hypothetical protein IPJ41_17095 [Phycisphaerales bacterium]|nr:hypothetical protein [Phycisphaerales bacterium]